MLSDPEAYPGSPDILDLDAEAQDFQNDDLDRLKLVRK